MRVRLQFKPGDMWVGVYWKRNTFPRAPWPRVAWNIWICLVPCFPIFITWAKPHARRPGRDALRKNCFSCGNEMEVLDEAGWLQAARVPGVPGAVMCPFCDLRQRRGPARADDYPPLAPLPPSTEYKKGNP